YKSITVTYGMEPVDRVDLQKGKSQTPATLEPPLHESIDIKGMRAQGDRISFHTVKQVKLITQDVDLTEVMPAAESPSSADNQNTADTEDTVIDQPAVQEEDQAETKPSATKTDADVSLEITNPGDINLNDSGQTSLF